MLPTSANTWHRSFEVVAAAWEKYGTVASITNSLDYARTGGRSCKFDNPTTSFDAREIRSSTVTVSAGTKYSAAIWVYVNYVNGNIADTKLRLRIMWYNSSGSYISEDSITELTVPSFNNWHRLEISAKTAPSGAVGARFSVSARETVNYDNDVYLDDGEFFNPAPYIKEFKLINPEAGQTVKGGKTYGFQVKAVDPDGPGHSAFGIDHIVVNFGGTGWTDEYVVNFVYNGGANPFFKEEAGADGVLEVWASTYGVSGNTLQINFYVTLCKDDGFSNTFPQGTVSASCYVKDLLLLDGTSNYTSAFTYIKDDAAPDFNATELLFPKWTNFLKPNIKVGQVQDTNSGLNVQPKEFPNNEPTTVAALYHLDEEEAFDQIYDASGNGKNGSGVDITWAEEDSIFGWGQNFNGSSAYLMSTDANGVLPTNTTSYTAECYFRANNIGGTQILISEGGAAWGYKLYLADGSGNLKFDVWGSTYSTTTGTPNASQNRSCSVSNGAVTLGEWHHIAAVFRGGEEKYLILYLDGDEVASCSTAPILFRGGTTGGRLYLGRDWSAAGYYNGTMDEVRISKIARSPNEIRKAARPTLGYQVSKNGGASWGANTNMDDAKWLDYRYGWDRYLISCSSTDATLAAQSIFVSNLSLPAFSSTADSNRIRFRISDVAGNIAYKDYPVNMESTPPSGWSNFAPDDWTYYGTPDCVVDVTDTGGSGISTMSAVYCYSKDGGTFWEPGDDFSDGDYTSGPFTWVTAGGGGPGTWDATNGYLRRTDSGTNWKYCRIQNKTFGDFIMEFDFCMTDGPGQFSAVIRSTTTGGPPQTWARTKEYVLRTYSGWSTINWIIEDTYWGYTSPDEPVFVYSTAGDWVLQSTYTVTIAVSSFTITAYIRQQGQPFASAELIGQLYDPNCSYSSGYVGFNVNGSASRVNIDNVVIWSTATWSNGTITAPSVPFNQGSETQNKIKFAVSDNAGNIGISDPYTVKINTIPPGPILDLTAEDASCGGSPKAQLTWSAPGEDGYTDPITPWGKIHIASTTVAADAQNPDYWSTTKRDNAEIKISTAGVNPYTVLSWNITSGLKDKTTYYFRVWTRDSAGNWAAVSNGATVYVDTTAQRTISGYVRDEYDNPLSGVLMVVNGHRNSTTLTDTNGYYAFLLPTCQQYIVMPSSGSMYFVNTGDVNQDRRVYTSLPTDKDTQNFRGYRAYGNLYYATDTTGNIEIDNANKKVSIRFVAERTDTYNRFYFFKPSWSGQTTNNFNMELRYNDADGKPGALVTAASTVSIDPTAASAWKSNDLSPSWSLVKGTTYHMVISFNTTDGTPGLRVRYSQPLVMRNPADSTPSPAHNVFYTADGGTTWTPQNRQPLYALNSGGTPPSEGNNYSTLTTGEAYKIYGDQWQGQQFWVETTTITAKEVNFFFRRVGTPADNCYWEIRGPGDFSVLFDSGTLVYSADAPTSYNWVTAVTQGMLCPKPLYPNNTYWVMLKSPGSASGAYYDLCTLNTALTTDWGRQLNYRGANSLYARSIDGGASIATTDDQRDNIFRIKISTVITEGPKPVTNLSALQAEETEGAIKLNWTCPGVCGTYPLVAGSLWRIHATDSLENAQNLLWWDKDLTSDRIILNISTGPVGVGELQTVIVPGLQENVTYYFRLWSRYGPEENWSLISNGATCYASPVPPAAVTSLTALPSVWGKCIDLAWSAPGDDGWNGDIEDGRYKIRYSTYAAPEPDFWDTAGWDDFVNKYEIIIATDTSPHNYETFVLTGLAPGVTYYIRVWTRDEIGGNWSVVSNAATTWAQIRVLGVEVQDTLMGPTSTYYNFGTTGTNTTLYSSTGIIVRNTGNVLQTYSLNIPTAAVLSEYSDWHTTFSESDIVNHNNKFIMWAIFKTTRPMDTSAFADDDVIISTDIAAAQKATPTRFSDGTASYGNSGTRTIPFIISPLLGDTTMWFKFLTPLATHTTAEQIIPIVITPWDSDDD